MVLLDKTGPIKQLPNSHEFSLTHRVIPSGVQWNQDQNGDGGYEKREGESSSRHNSALK